MNITEQIKIIKRNRLFPGELFISDLFEQFVITNTNEYKNFEINDNTIMSFYLGRLFFSDAIIKYLKIIEKNVDDEIITNIIKKYSKILFNIDVNNIVYTLNDELYDERIFNYINCEKMFDDLFSKIKQLNSDIIYFTINNISVIEINDNKFNVVSSIYNYFKLINAISKNKFEILIKRKIKEYFNININDYYMILI